MAALANQNYDLVHYLVSKHQFNLNKELLLDPDEDIGEDTAG